MQEVLEGTMGRCGVKVIEGEKGCGVGANKVSPNQQVQQVQLIQLIQLIPSPVI